MPVLPGKMPLRVIPVWQNAFTLYGPLYLTTRVLELTQMQYWDLLLAGKMPLYGDTLS